MFCFVDLRVVLGLYCWFVFDFCVDAFGCVCCFVVYFACGLLV